MEESQQPRHMIFLILVRREATNPDNLVRRITGSKCYTLSGKTAVKWGTDNEEKARYKYVETEKANHKHMKVTTFILPELVTRKLEHSYMPSNENESMDETGQNVDEKELWCLCQEPEYGRMIKCVNEDCPTQWFHYECVNIRRCPRGKWVCPECSEAQD
ncbi:uncharacterized protein LOC128558320 [Mercenaria mercenaria]|uniref:uncharacterized protein LOC128558320 n=1 Tax=Mercenaria mercenaria TaxID=6596 RepID=UPI00234ED10D|nr:uncharacterized protein LOC128558320 [Mercenaria mercenaria]